METIIQGAKGGSGSQHTPTETPDTLHEVEHARIVDAISEGPIKGFVHGSANPLKDVYLNETPVANEDGSFNFSGIVIDSRSGTQDQDPMAQFANVENEIAVGVELRSSAPWVQALTDLDLDAVRIRIAVPQLQKSDTSNGDITGYTIEYKIELSVDGGAFDEVLTSAFSGKTTSEYDKTHLINLPDATSTGWVIRVTRTTANLDSAAVADTTNIMSYTEIVSAKLRYPNTALVGIVVDAKQFSGSVPTRSYHIYGRVISVPSNYDPIARTYTGTWDGSFKPAWTNNPVWIYYDLVTHPRYGLGQWVSAARMNKWALYDIAQYCDQLVPDGKGGQEPRFTCNVYIQSQQDAHKVLADLTSVFRGMAFWAGGAIQTTADMPGDPEFVYTNANVVGGKFSYQSSDRKTRYTVALVSWNDPADFGRAKVTYVPDRDGIARYGVRQTQVIAFGATSEGQAWRQGMWVLLTSRLETETVSWQVGQDGHLVAPGKIARIADAKRAQNRQGGRIRAATDTVVTIDKPPGVIEIGASLTVMLPSGVSETRTISDINESALTVSTAFSEVPKPEAMWVVETSSLYAQTVRILSIAEPQSSGEDSLTFTVTAVQHNASKFDAVDFGAMVFTPPTVPVLGGTLAAPTVVSVTSYARKGAARAIPVLEIGWPRVAGATKYLVQYRRNDGEWSVVHTVGGNRLEVENVLPGDYVAQVAAANKLAESMPTISDPYTLDDSALTPTIVDDIQAQANAAKAEADQANADLANIASDNVLTPGEKPVVIRDYNVITTEQPGIDAQAAAYGITTEKAAYDGKVSALTTYLGTLTSPAAWNDLGGNTTIVGADFRQAFADVYTSRQALLNAIYAEAKARADAAQAAADQANSNVPHVINGCFTNSTAGWTFDNPTGFYQNDTDGNSPDSAQPSHLVRQGQAGGAATYARNQGYVAVVPGQTLTAVCCMQSFSANAGSYGGCRISWRDASHSEVGTPTLASITVGPGGSFTHAVSKAVGQAPAGASFAHFELYYVNHSSGYINATSCGLSVQPASVDEVPDGATYARTQAFTMQNGVVVPFGNGDNLIPNHSFANNEASIPANTPRLAGQDLCDGWLVTELAGSYMSVQYESASDRLLFRLTQGVTIPASTTVRCTALGARKIPVTPNETLYVACTMRRDANQAYPATPTVSIFGGLHFYDSSGTIIDDRGATGDKTITAQATQYAAITVPSNASYAVPRVSVAHTTAGFAFDTSAGLYADIRITDLQVVRQLALETAGSGRRLGDQRNQVMVGVGNFAAGWSGGAITFSATSSTASVTVGAGTLQVGGTSIAYNQATVAIGGGAGGVTRTYYLYYDDDAYAGGSQALHATSNQITSLSADGRFLVGTVTITFPTSGTSTGNGAVGCPQVNEPVIRRAPDGSQETIRAGDVRVGDHIKLFSGRWGLVSYSEAKLQPGVRVVGMDGSSITCSESAPLETAEGPCVPAAHVDGLVLRHCSAGVMRVRRVIDQGLIWVQHITCENDCFLVGDYSHHNRKPLS